MPKKYMFKRVTITITGFKLYILIHNLSKDAKIQLVSFKNTKVHNHISKQPVLSSLSQSAKVQTKIHVFSERKTLSLTCLININAY